MILETERLQLRQMNQADYPDLCEILQDEEVMYAYDRKSLRMLMYKHGWIGRTRAIKSMALDYGLSYSKTRGSL